MKKTLGQALKSAREALGLTQRQLAAQVGVKASHVAFLESDRRRPSLGLLSRLAEVLGLEKDKLFLLAHPEASSLLEVRRRVAPPGRAWGEFVNDKALLARHNVRPAELEVLFQTNLLGRIIAPRDFLFILNSIRQAADAEL
jgi:transcriptional regulator with XRE-family HTH domain